MAHPFQLWPQRSAIVITLWLLLASVQLGHAQALRGPDLGVWFNQQRDAGGSVGLMVDSLLDDGPFARAGLRDGDRVASIDGRPIDSEPQFVRAVMSPANGDHMISVVVARNDQQQTLSLTSRDVWQGVVAADPFYQAGLLVDERRHDAIIVLRVFPLTPAFYAGLWQADTITSVGGQPISSPADLAKVLRIGGNLTLGVIRNGQTRQMTISLPSRRTMAATTYPLTGASQPLPPIVPNRGGLSSPPLLAPPMMPSTQPPIPSPPPAIPSLPPPGAVPNGPRG